MALEYEYSTHCMQIGVHKGMHEEREGSITLSSARTCTFLDLLITTPAPLLLLTRRWPRMEENAKLHDDACDTGVEMAEVVATPATTFIVAMVAAAAISSFKWKKKSLQTTTNFTTVVDCEECLRNEVQGFDV